ncbi:MAG: hypothetical protein AABY92_05515 [Thermodesulfobacteriota bacterium]
MSKRPLRRCWESSDAKTATPTRFSFELLERLISPLCKPGLDYQA